MDREQVMSMRLIQVTTLCGLAALLVLTVGCASSQTATDWKPGMSAYFSNDVIHLDLDSKRPWTKQDEETLLHQLGLADAVALGSLRTLQQASQYGADSHLSLAFRPAEILHGALKDDVDASNQLVVEIAPSEEALRIAQRLPARAGDTRFLLLIKRQPRPEGGHDLRWAIYEPSPELMSRVRSLFRRLKQDGRG